MLDFLQGESAYRVVRKRQLGKSARSPGRSTLDLYVWDESKRQWSPSPTRSSLRETEQKIVELIRLDYETLVHSAFAAGRADALHGQNPVPAQDIRPTSCLTAGSSRGARQRYLGQIDHELSVIDYARRDRHGEEPPARAIAMRH
jgi:hypothetical protein